MRMDRRGNRMVRTHACSVIGTAGLKGLAIGAAAFGALAIDVAFAADAANGKRLAERWCEACHVVTASQSQASADAPPFAEIARRPNFNETGLVTFLLDPHAKMPNMSLSRIEAGDIVAYIATLK
jgi:mono/diheme cytochrome c family protein